jgi:hypothetical protein
VRCRKVGEDCGRHLHGHEEAILRCGDPHDVDRVEEEEDVD